MNKSTLIKLAYAAALVLVVGGGVYEYRAADGLSGIRSKQTQIHDLTIENAKLREEIDHKEARISRLASNRAEQEMAIRKKLELVKPGEQVFILQDSKQGPKQSDPKAAPTTPATR